MITEYVYDPKMTPLELTDAVAAGMPFEHVAVQCAPLINKFASQHLPGFHREDIEVEVQLALWKVHNSFDPAKGSFLNVTIRSMTNRMIQLKKISEKQVQPVSRLMCQTEDCGAVIPVTARGPKCLKCGKREWKAIRSEHNLKNIGALEEANPGFDIPSREDGTGDLEMDLFMDSLQNEDLWLVQKALDGFKLTKKEKARLAEIYLK